MKELFHFVSQLGTLDPELKAALANILRYQDYSKGSYLLNAGHICNRIWFLQHGITRTFLKTDDREITTWINLPLTVIYAGNNFIERIPSDESIQALEHCSVWFITKEELQQLFSTFPHTLDMHQNIYTQYVRQVKSHSNMKGSTSLEQRFLWLKANFPDLIFTGDPNILASFISVSRRSFFNLKKKLAGG